jgi:hypothetical protein
MLLPGIYTVVVVLSLRRVKTLRYKIARADGTNPW